MTFFNSELFHVLLLSHRSEPVMTFDDCELLYESACAGSRSIVQELYAI